MRDGCPNSDELRGLITGELQLEAAGAVGQHVDTCAHCETELVRLEQEVLSEFRGVSRLNDGSFQDEFECSRALRRIRGLNQRNLGAGAVLNDGTQPPPDVVRDYELLELLGDGGMGLVFRARHMRLDQFVALKLIRPERMGHRQAIERFEREMKAAGQLQHPNIVAARDAGEVDGHHFLVMDLLDGETLAERVIRNGSMRVDEACELIAQAATGLQHIYEAGMVHRDIKPSNLFVTQDQVTQRPVVKILDMGLALLDVVSEDDGLTREDQVMGTYDYIAPEQAKRSHDVDIRADIYSLGCTLYFLLTGHAPFQEATRVQKLLAHQSDALPTVSGLPENVINLMTRMTAKAPEDRFQTPAEVVEALACVEVWPEAPVVMPVTRRSLRVVGVASLVIPLAIAVAAILNGMGRTRPGPQADSAGTEAEPIVTDLSAAEWVRSIGGEIRINAAATVTFTGELSELPPDFRLTGVDLAEYELAARDLRRFDGLQNLQRVLLRSTGGGAHCQDIVEILPQLDLPALRWLYLRDLPITDDDIEHVCAIRQVSSISLLGSRITDVGLSRLAAMPRLSSLELSGTAVTGRGLSSLRNHNVLQLRLIECPLDSEAFIALPHWPELRVLLIDGCPLNNQAIQSIGRFEQLTEFGGNVLECATNDAWTVFEDLPNLTKVRLRGNASVDDAAVQTLSGLAKLNQLSLHSCGVTAEGLKSLSRCSQLRELDVRGCKRLTPEGVRELRGLLGDCVILSDF